MNAINTNVQSLVANRVMGQNIRATNATLEQMATGYRINRGADDPAGLISSESLRAALATLESETRLLERADAVASTADAALSEVSGALADLNAAAVASANTAGMSEAEREAYQLTADSALQTIQRVASTTRFNGDALLDGSAVIRVAQEELDLGNAAPSAIGAVADGGGRTFSLQDLAAGRGLNLVDGDIITAQQAIAQAAGDVAGQRGRIGAFQANVIDARLRAADVAYENTAAANSQIRDTDYALAAARLARSQTLTGSSLRVAGIANSTPETALRLLS